MSQNQSTQRCYVRDLKPGMLTGQALFSDNGTVWLAEGTTLSEELIRRIQLRDQDAILIRKPLDGSDADEPYHAVENIPEATPLFEIASSALQAKVENEYESVLDSVRQAFLALSQKGKPDYTELWRAVDRILEWTTRSAFLANYLLLAAPRNDYPIQHSVHVAAISGIIGSLLALPADQLRELVLSGLLHDIGFLTASAPTTPSGLLTGTVENRKGHPVLGYKMLQSQPNIPANVLFGVLQHHERLDGSGYPLGIGKEKIHLYAKIIGVADTYDLMSANRENAHKLSPFSVMQRLKDEMIERLDAQACTAFLEYLTSSVLGNIVMLSDGSIAQVVFWHQADSLPTVRTESGQFINLAKQKQVSIVEILGA